MAKLKPERLTNVNVEYLEYLDKQVDKAIRHLLISRRILKRLQPVTRKTEDTKK